MTTNVQAAQSTSISTHALAIYAITTAGFALSVPDKFMDVRLIGQLLHSPPSEVISQIKINFSMIKRPKIWEYLPKVFAFAVLFPMLMGDEPQESW